MMAWKKNIQINCPHVYFLFELAHSLLQSRWDCDRVGRERLHKNCKLQREEVGFKGEWFWLHNWLFMRVWVCGWHWLLVSVCGCVCVWDVFFFLSEQRIENLFRCIANWWCTLSRWRCFVWGRLGLASWECEWESNRRSGLRRKKKLSPSILTAFGFITKRVPAQSLPKQTWVQKS